MKTDIGQLDYVHPKLRTLCMWLETTTGMEFTETSRYRIGDTGVHGTLPVRGIDLRCKVKRIGVEIVEYINTHWVYDKSRPLKVVAMYHDVGDGWHIHLQVHDKTKMAS